MAVLRIAVNPTKTLRFAFVAKSFSGVNSCVRQSIVRRVKEIWKKFNLNTSKKRPVLLERDSRWSFSLVKMLFKQNN